MLLALILQMIIRAFLSFWAWPHEVFESSGVKLKNGLKIVLKTMVLVVKKYGLL